MCTSAKAQNKFQKNISHVCAPKNKCTEVTGLLWIDEKTVNVVINGKAVIHDIQEQFKDKGKVYYRLKSDTVCWNFLVIDSDRTAFITGHNKKGHYTKWITFKVEKKQ